MGPIFAATKQKGPREVTIRVKVNGETIERRYFLGANNPLRPNNPPPALDTRHARALLTLVSFFNPYSNSRMVRFSVNEFCRRYANTNGGRYSRSIREILGDLTVSYIRVLDVKKDIGMTYRLIEDLSIEDKPIYRKNAALAKSGQRELWLHGCTLSKEFYDMMTRIAELRDLKLSVLTSLRSPLAQAIYLYIPSRAYHHSEGNPFEITLTTLLEQVSFPVPRYKSLRCKLFTQNSRSICDQLDGAETLTGHFRVSLAETADGSDWKLLAWVDHDRRASKLTAESSKLLATYLQSGRPREFFDRAIANIERLSDYDVERLKIAGVVIEGSETFLELAKAILPNSMFNTLLSEAKSDELEGRKARKNPTARLIHRIMEAIAAPPAKSAPATRQ